MNTEEIVDRLNPYLNTEFIIGIYGGYQTSPKNLPNDKKYIMIMSSTDDDVCYMDWRYNDFSLASLLEYTNSIPSDQGSGDGDNDKLYMLLYNKLLKFYKEITKNEIHTK